MRLNRMNRLSIDEIVDIYDKLLEEQDYELRDCLVGVFRDESLH